MEHLEHNHILYELQYGFRHNKSCESQLISLINDLTKNYDAGQQSYVICMDIAKAFDIIPHNRLKLKLQCMVSQELPFSESHLFSQCVIKE